MTSSHYRNNSWQCRYTNVVYAIDFPKLKHVGFGIPPSPPRMSEYGSEKREFGKVFDTHPQSDPSSDSKEKE